MACYCIWSTPEILQYNLPDMIFILIRIRIRSRVRFHDFLQRKCPGILGDMQTLSIEHINLSLCGRF